MEHKDVLIVGGGPAGRVIVHKLHQANSGLSVGLIKDEPINVNRCAVPYGVSAEKPIKKFCIPNTLVTDYGAELILDQVVMIDPEKQYVKTKTGQEIGFKYLVLATGSKPIIPALSGINAQNVFSVRSKEDLERLRSSAEEYKKVVIVGGGYIGVEVGVVLRSLGLEVVIVEMMPHIMGNAAEQEFINDIAADVRKHGIELLMDTKVEEFVQQGNRVHAVKLSTGDDIPADFVVLSMGVSPNIDIAEKAGIATSQLGITVDEHLRTNFPNIFASGDCALKTSYVTGQPTRGEFGTNAVFMSQVVGANILGQKETFPGVINASVTETFDFSLGSAGLIEQTALKEGMDILTGYSEVPNKYPMIDGVSMVKTKLIFERSTQRLIGGSVLRQDHCVAQNIDFISFAIQMKAKINDILSYQYSTHPKLAAKPSDNIFVNAAKDALIKLKNP